MPNPIWPDDLPQDITLEDYDETGPFPVLRTDMEVGPAKQRSIATAAATPRKFGTLPLNRAEYQIFLDFWIETLGNGSLPFDWFDPLTNDTATFRNTAGFKPVPVGAGDDVKVRVILTLERMP